MHKTLITVILLGILASACSTQRPIGGDKDNYGCLVSAGYSWNESISACVRNWELNENTSKAAQIVVAPMSVVPRTIVKVDELACSGCFLVYIFTSNDSKTTQVKLVDWKIVYDEQPAIENFEECVKAGNPIMESYPRKCSVQGKTFAENLTHVCTQEESQQVACTLEYNPVCGELLLNTGKTMYQTFGNGCAACAALKVVSYTPGECVTAPLNAK